MLNYKRLICIVLVLVFVLATFSFNYAEENSFNEDSYKKLFIKFDFKKLSKKMFDEFGFKSNEIFEELGVLEVELPPGIDFKNYIKKLNKSKLVEFVEEDYKVNINKVPNDIEYIKQWGPKAINAEKAWDITTGSEDIKIAVLDTGIQRNHPDLKDNVIGGYNIISPGLPPEDDNMYYHGTHVSGIIAGTINNNIGIAGIAGNAKIMPIKVLDYRGSGYYSDIMYGIIWAVNNGADVINMSFGGYGKSRLFEMIMDYAYSNGVTLVAAAGNDNSNSKMYPASFRNVISVAALDEDITKAYFSNYGYNIDFAAPGVDIYSTVNYPENPYEYYSGTSMAAPFVSASAALILSNSENVSPYQVKKALTETAKDLGAPGKDIYYGYGIVNIYEALNY